MGARVRLPRLVLPLLAMVAVARVHRHGRHSPPTRRRADSNESAFRGPCVGFQDSHPARMLALALTGLRSLGYSDYRAHRDRLQPRQPSSPGQSTTSASTSIPMATSTGTPPGQRRYNGFREDSGDCSQAVIFSNGDRRGPGRPVHEPGRRLDVSQRRSGHHAAGRVRNRADQIPDRRQPLLPGLRSGSPTTTTSRPSKRPSGRPWSAAERRGGVRSRRAPELHPPARSRLVGHVHLVRPGRRRHRLPALPRGRGQPMIARPVRMAPIASSSVAS